MGLQFPVASELVSRGRGAGCTGWSLSAHEKMQGEFSFAERKQIIADIRIFKMLHIFTI